MKTAVIHTDRYRDGRAYALDIVREDNSGLHLPSRREFWRVFARNEQEALRTIEYHFGLTALWYRQWYEPISLRDPLVGDERPCPCLGDHLEADCYCTGTGQSRICACNSRFAAPTGSEARNG